MFPAQPLQLDDSTDSKALPSPSVTSSSKKQHLSQSSLDMYFASSLSSSSGSAHKKTSKPGGKSEKPVLKKQQKKSPGKSQKPAVTKSPSKPPTKHSSPKSLILTTNSSGGSSMPLQSTGVVTQSSPKPQTPRTPVKTLTKSPLLSCTSSTSVIMSAKKTRTLQQIREQLRRKFLTTEHRIRLEGEMKRKLDEQKEERKKVRDKSTWCYCIEIYCV